MSRVPPCLCPWCGYMSDAATSVGKAEIVPKPDDISMCIDCGGLLVFKPDLTMRKPEPEDLKDAPQPLLDLIDRMRLLQAAIPGRMKRRKGMA